MHELKNPPFSQTKSYPFAQAFPYCPFRKKLFHHKRFPFAPSHNLLSTKNVAILFIIALNPYAVTPEPRTDSKPFRRRFVRKTDFGSCRRKYLQNYFRQSFESSPGVQRAAALGVFLWYFLHAAKSTNPYSLAGRFEVFQTSKQPTIAILPLYVTVLLQISKSVAKTKKLC